MSATIINFIIQLVAGAVGGNLAAKAKDFGLGPVGNTISGAIGGGLGGQILTSLIPALTGAGGVDIGTILGQAVGRRRQRRNRHCDRWPHQERHGGNEIARPDLSAIDLDLFSADITLEKLGLF